jgi:hypothetical protein
MQDGLDLINALATHPETARRLATKLYTFFVSETIAPDTALIDDSRTSICRAGPSSGRYCSGSSLAAVSEPVGVLHALLVAGGIRGALDEGGRLDGFSVGSTLVAARQHGTAAARIRRRRGMGPRPELVLHRRDARAHELRIDARVKPEIQPGHAAAGGRVDLARRSRLPADAADASLDTAVYSDLLAYASAGITWSGSDAQLQSKAPGLVHLILGSPDYQFV